MQGERREWVSAAAKICGAIGFCDQTNVVVDAENRMQNASPGADVVCARESAIWGVRSVYERFRVTHERNSVDDNLKNR